MARALVPTGQNVRRLILEEKHMQPKGTDKVARSDWCIQRFGNFGGPLSFLVFAVLHAPATVIFAAVSRLAGEEHVLQFS